MHFLYLHGFNSDGDGWKAKALQRQFPESTIAAPDLPAAPEEVWELLLASYAAKPDQIVIGTSLGGFYAYCYSAHFQVPAWLFNPSLQPYETLDGRGVGHFKTWTKGRDYHFKQEYLEQLRNLRAVADRDITPERLRFFLATDDDVLNHHLLPGLFPASPIQWIEKAGHGFSKFEKILKSAKKEGWIEK